MARKRVPTKVETAVLTRSGRRCCLCVGLNGDWGQKRGQIAHLDQDPSNNAGDNLAFLCLPHHDQYDSKTSQSKGITVAEVRQYREELYVALSDFRESWHEETNRKAVETMPKPKRPDFEALIRLAGSFSLTADRDAEYARLLTLALKYQDPETATRLAKAFSLTSARDRAYWRILKYHLEEGEPNAALPVVGMFSLSRDRDQAKRKVLEAMKDL